MPWQKKDEHVDKRTGRHVVNLHEPLSGAEHQLILLIGHDACPGCGAVHLREKRTPQQHVAETLKMLQESHDRMDAYARKHGIPVRKAAKH